MWPTWIMQICKKNNNKGGGGYLTAVAMVTRDGTTIAVPAQQGHTGGRWQRDAFSFLSKYQQGRVSDRSQMADGEVWLYSPIRPDRLSPLFSSFATFGCHSRDAKQSGKHIHVGLLGGFGAAIFTEMRGKTSAIAEYPGGDWERDDATILVPKKGKEISYLIEPGLT